MWNYSSGNPIKHQAGLTSDDGGCNNDCDYPWHSARLTNEIFGSFILFTVMKCFSRSQVRLTTKSTNISIQRVIMNPQYVFLLYVSTYHDTCLLLFSTSDNSEYTIACSSWCFPKWYIAQLIADAVVSCPAIYKKNYTKFVKSFLKPCFSPGVSNVIIKVQYCSFNI